MGTQRGESRNVLPYGSAEKLVVERALLDRTRSDRKKQVRSVMITTVEEEMAYVFGCLGYGPQDAQRVFEAVQEGKIDGSLYAVEGEGCFYGHLARLDAEQACQVTSQVRGQCNILYFPIEVSLYGVQPGDRPTDDSEEGWALRKLVEALIPYLPPEGQRAAALLVRGESV